ncbi:LuxR C-terminal-related transcriptional regulator [Mariniblastus fucicola]|uniref:Transcriptional regulatory protein LiaR n=2 Tax=Mariniblastus fucicola TaxID=980251 RepID=A0A5B9PEF7_9BACT|nr:response regulator transcription factor [Mariniblastus fucicola]QEG21343.1 Transcriptional regulatory protein LiaR [Mariniblastus fucicola]
MSVSSMTLEIVIADDHPVVVEGIRSRIESYNAKIVANPTDPESLVQLVEEIRPDVLVMESRLGKKDALRALEKFQNLALRPPVVVFSMYPDATHIARASALGCHDYILKSSPIDALFEAVNRASRGESAPADSLLNTVRTRMRSNSGTPHADLTNREMQVLRHVAMGLSNREIGKSLGISVETVKEHVQNILRKLNVNDRTQAAVWAVRNQLIA